MNKIKMSKFIKTDLQSESELEFDNESQPKSQLESDSESCIFYHPKCYLLFIAVLNDRWLIFGWLLLRWLLLASKITTKLRWEKMDA